MDRMRRSTDKRNTCVEWCHYNGAQVSRQVIWKINPLRYKQSAQSTQHVVNNDLREKKKLISQIIVCTNNEIHCRCGIYWEKETAGLIRWLSKGCEEDSIDYWGRIDDKIKPRHRKKKEWRKIEINWKRRRKDSNRHFKRSIRNWKRKEWEVI